VSSLPNNWQTISLRYISECLDGKRIPLNSEERGTRQGEYPYWGANSIVDYVDEYLFDESLVLLGEDGAPFFDKTKPVAFLVNDRVWVNNHIHVLRIKNGFDSKFVVYSLNATDYGQWINGSTRDKLTQENMGSIKIYFPPLPEQHAIADYLDRETAHLDSLIAAKEHLLELLAEKRRAVIMHAVTRGLNPNVSLRDSGMEWLGEIPSHWETVKIKYIAQVGNGSTPFRDNLTYWKNGKFPWLTSTVVNADIVGEPTDFVTEVALKECHLPIVQPNSILVAITGEGKTRGKASILRYQATINQHLAFISLNTEMMIPEYLQVFLSSSYEILRMISDGSGSTKGALTCEQLNEYSVLLPPLAEQQQVVEYINEWTTRIDRLYSMAEKTLNLLHERRTSLIAAAVSGQIRVV